MDPIIASEEIVETPLTPERIHPKDATTPRRNSTGRVSTSSSGEKVLPIYLRASTNSCHDFCKYGRHHASEAKERYPIPKRFAAVTSKIQIPVKSITLQERKKKLVVEPKPLPETKTQAPDKLKVVKRDIKIVTREVSSPKIVTQEVSSPSKKTTVAAKLANGSKPPLSPKNLDVTPKPASGLKSKPMTVKLSSSPLSNSSGGQRNSDIGIANNTISRRRNSDIGIVNNIQSSKLGERKSLVPPTSSLSPKPSGNGVSSLSSRKPRVLKAATPLKNQSLLRKGEPKLPNDDKLKEKTLYDIESKPEKKISSPSTSGSRSFSTNSSRSNRPPGISGSRSFSTNSSRSNRTPGISGSRTHSINGSHSNRSASISGSRTHSINGSHSNRSASISGSRTHSINGSHSNRSASISGSRSPSINSIHSNRSPGLSGSRSFQTSSFSSSMYSSLSSSQSLCTDEEEEQGYESTPSKNNASTSSKPKEIKNGNQVTTSKPKYRRTRTGMVHSEERDSARKLKFRRGKVVNPEDEINNSRRLRFKQGRVLGDNQTMKSDDLKRRSFRKREDDGDKNGKKPESEKVVLRHQDVQVAKDAQGLFNNVIEETASKLVEARKSKVKALVGAFETVISLQETKPASASSNG